MSIRLVRELPSLDLATRIASSGFVQPISDALRIDVETHVKDGEIVYSIYQHTQLVGFAIFHLFMFPDLIGPVAFDGYCDDAHVLYLSGIILHESVQGKGIAEKVICHVKSTHHITHLALRTQSLRMWKVGAKLCWNWQPDRVLSSRGGVRAVTSQLAERLNLTVDKSHVARGFYGAPLYGVKPVYHDVALQAWWDQICSFERGDAVLCVGCL